MIFLADTLFHIGNGGAACVRQKHFVSNLIIYKRLRQRLNEENKTKTTKTRKDREKTNAKQKKNRARTYETLEKLFQRIILYLLLPLFFYTSSAERARKKGGRKKKLSPRPQLNMLCALSEKDQSTIAKLNRKCKKVYQVNSLRCCCSSSFFVWERALFCLSFVLVCSANVKEKLPILTSSTRKIVKKTDTKEARERERESARKRVYTRTTYNEIKLNLTKMNNQSRMIASAPAPRISQ